MTDTDVLAVPIKGSMFQSHMASRKVPPPFPGGMVWQHMKCPWCRHRPFINEGVVTISRDGKTYTAGEKVEIPKTQAQINQDLIDEAFKEPEPEPYKFVCGCGAAFRWPGQLRQHRRKCEQYSERHT